MEHLWGVDVPYHLWTSGAKLVHVTKIHKRFRPRKRILHVNTWKSKLY